MKKQYMYIICLLSILAGRSVAQESLLYTHDNTEYIKAVSVYDAGQYAIAKTMFKNISSSSLHKTRLKNSSFYEASCALLLQHDNANNLMEDFIEKYPESIHLNTAYLQLADYSLLANKHTKALAYYQRVNLNTVPKDKADAFHFNITSCFMNAQQYAKAKAHILKIDDTAVYSTQIDYYLGVIAYQFDDYNTANKHFSQLPDQTEYMSKTAYFQANIQFKSGNFDKAIDLASQKLPLAIDDGERSQLNKIIGESFFELKKYDKALSYLQRYKGINGKWTDTDHYQLGYVHFFRNEFQAAISEFTKIISGQTAVAQNAYMHLAICYMHLDKKTEALHAFKNASEMNFHPELTENAALNYAKLSYEMGNPFVSVPKVLLNFMHSYPNSKALPEMEQLLINAYVSSKNYEDALVMLENESDVFYQKIYQKVAYYHATTLLKEGEYSEAIAVFKKALRFKHIPEITANTYYWNATATYAIGNYKTAIELYNNHLQSAKNKAVKNVNYQLGYSYFKLKKYEDAIPYFETFITENHTDDKRLDDAYLRLGDCYFASANYWKAMTHYNTAKARAVSDADYAHFQKAISYGFAGKNTEKIADLKQLLKDYPESPYCDKALFELANTYVVLENIPEALKSFNKIVYSYPKSPLVVRAMLKQGLLFYNANKNEQALNKYKQVAMQYPATAAAHQAVSSARVIYIDLNRANDYVSWVKRLPFIAVENADFDHATYEAAEKQFMQQKPVKALKSFENYIQDFPNGIHLLSAHFYSAKLNKEANQLSNAVAHYKAVIEHTKNEYTIPALSAIAQLYLDSNQLEEAVLVLEKLAQLSNNYNDVVFAQSNLMQLYYQLKNHEKTIACANTILQNPKIDHSIHNRARVLIARTAIATDNFEIAEMQYAALRKNAVGVLAAESLYYKAFFEYKKSNFLNSNITIQELTKTYSKYKRFAAKGLVLMAKNFYELNDSYQATYILEKVIAHFDAYPEIVKTATETLNTIKLELLKTNATTETPKAN